MKKCFNFIITLLFIFIIPIGCSQNKKISEMFLQQEKVLYSTYNNSSADIAKEALKEYLNIVLDYQRSSIKGIDYPTVIVGTYVRLYMIENHLKNRDNAELYLEKAFQIALSEAKSEGIDKGIDIKKEKLKLIKCYKEIDIRNSVKWVKDAQ